MYTGSCPAIALHLNRVLSTFSFTCVTIDAVIYTACCYCYFQFVFSAKIFLKALVFLCINTNSWVSYEYFVYVNFDVSLCRFWHSCFGMRLMFLNIYVSDMHLSGFLCAFLINVIFRAFSTKNSYLISTLNLQNLSIFITKCGNFFSIFVAKFGISNGNFPRCQASCAKKKKKKTTGTGLIITATTGKYM